MSGLVSSFIQPFHIKKKHLGKLLRDLNTQNQHRFPSKARGLAGMHRSLYRGEEVGVSTL